MAKDIFTLQIDLTPIRRHGMQPQEVESSLHQSLSSNASVELRPVYRSLGPMPEPHKFVEAHPERADLLRGFLNEEDYKSMGREFGDLSGITWGDIDRLGYQIGGGGEGALYDFVVTLMSSDATVTVTIISSLAIVVNTLIKEYFQRNSQRVFKIKHGEDEIDLSGYPKDEATRLADEYFSKIRRDKLLK